MAYIRWVGTGGVSGAIADNANWSGGTAPGGSDYAVFDDLAVYDALTGTLPDCTGVIVTPGFKYNFGTATTPVTIGSVSGAANFGGRGQLVNIAVASGKTVASMRLDSGICSISGAGTVTLLNDNVGATISVTALTTLRTALNIKTTVSTSATAITTLHNSGNTEITGRNVTTGYNNSTNSRLTTKGTTTGTGASTSAIATLLLADGSIYNKQSAATDTTIEASGRSVITCAGKPYSAAAVTDITTLNRSGEAIIVKSAQGATLTITNDNVSAPDDEGIPGF